MQAKQSFRLLLPGRVWATAVGVSAVWDGCRDQTYDRLVLRGGGNNDWLGHGLAEEAVYVRDQLVRDLHAAMGQVAARGRWVELYLNGDYWGLYNLTERIDDAFLTTHFGHDDWDIVRSLENMKRL